MRPLQVTCLCHAYPFPHRIDGGKCDGSDWAESYREIDGMECHTCNCLNIGASACRGSRSGECDVAEGIETIKHCEGYEDYLHSQTIQRLPTSFEHGLVDDRYGYVRDVEVML